MNHTTPPITNITTQSIGNLRRIGILGKLETQADYSNLHALLEQARQDEILQIDFYDAKTLPANIIAAITQCMDRGVSIRMISYFGLLSNSLLRLGLPVQQAPVSDSPGSGFFSTGLTGTETGATTIDETHTSITDDVMKQFLEKIWQRYGYDFREYQQASLRRRITTIMTRLNLPDFDDFDHAIFSAPNLFNRMVAEISVSVSDFFRHPEQFKLLREQIFPYLESFPVVKCWSAGCATGEEAYSLAILLEELGLLKRSRLFATDFNGYLLDLAKNGLFPLKSLQPGQQNYRQSGGQHHFDASITTGKHYFSIKEHLRNATLFHRHSLVDEGIFNEFQLIVCRNVMIYFKPELQASILARFARSLHHDGFLVLGPQDGIDHLARLAGFVPYIKGSHIYRADNRLSSGGFHD